MSMAITSTGSGTDTVSTSPRLLPSRFNRLRVDSETAEQETDTGFHRVDPTCSVFEQGSREAADVGADVANDSSVDVDRRHGQRLGELAFAAEPALCRDSNRRVRAVGVPQDVAGGSEVVERSAPR